MLVVLGARQRSFTTFRMTKPRGTIIVVVMLERSEASLNTGQRSFALLRMTKPREDNHRPFKNLLKAIFITIIPRFYDSLAVIHSVQKERKEYFPGCKKSAR